MKIFILEDNKERINWFIEEFGTHHDLTIEKNTEGAKKSLLSDSFDVAMLDHDLGGEVYVDSEHEDCGMRVAEFIVENQIPLNAVIVHSWNPVGARNMYDYFIRAGYSKTFMQKFGTFDNSIF